MGKRSQRARVVALCGAIGLAAAACSGGGSDEASETSESPETADTSPRVLQELWILERADAIDLDGELVDLASPLVDTVAASTGDPVELSSKVTFAPSRDFEVAMVDARENELESIDVVGGVVEDREGGRAVAIVATPEQGERTIGKNHVLRWGLPPTPAVVDGTPIVTEYAYAHIHPADGEPSGADVDPLALLAARTGAGTVASFVDDAGNSLIVTGEIGVARSSSSG